jgi:hypothetical protein
MSYNGSGTFQINTSGQPVVTGTVISSSAFNALTADLATGLSTAITKDGQTATTVRIPFAQGINSTLATDATSSSTGSIITAGGVGIAKALNVGSTTDSSSTSTGSIVAAGGLGIAKALYVGTTATIDTITSKAATALTLKSAGTTAVTLDTSQNATFAGTLTTASRGIATASMPAGTVLQVVQAVYAIAVTTTSGSYVTTGASASITPTSATSKILVSVSGTGGNSTSNWIWVTAYRNNTTNISTSGSGNPAGFYNNNSSDYLQTISFQILDSPATTSSTSYTAYFKCSGGSVRFGVDTMPTYITLIEVAA